MDGYSSRRTGCSDMLNLLDKEKHLKKNQRPHQAPITGNRQAVVYTTQRRKKSYLNRNMNEWLNKSTKRKLHHRNQANKLFDTR